MGQQKNETANDASFIINIINLDSAKDQLVIEGGLPHIDGLDKVYKLSPRFNGEPLDYLTYPTSNRSFTELTTNTLDFRFQIPAKTDGELKIFLELESNKSSPIELNLEFTRLSRISGVRRSDYRVIGNQLLVPRQKSLTITGLTSRKIIMLETSFFIQSLRERNIKRNVIKSFILEFLRISAILRRGSGKSSVWLFSDRMISGGDNSEALFRYVSKQNHKNIKPYFAINANTATYRRLKRDGYKVVKFRSIKHLYLAMIADLLLPSHMDVAYMYPWEGVWRKYVGLLQYKIVHTQHGIVLNDQSEYIGKRKKNAQLFLSICEWEKRHLVEPQYGYTETETPVTGAPRYDELDKLPTGRVISLHPTWRSWLVSKRSGAFKESDFFKFYQSLINDVRILNALRENNYTLKFYLHPNHRANLPDFSVKDDRVRLMQFPYDYNAMFSESAAFVTDYSNTLFDFAYLRKPVIHTQFDPEEFFSKQHSIARQLFDYEREGFGPVCRDYESAVREIVKAIEAGPKMQKKYKERADRFFTYSDKNNCKRAYETILRFQNQGVIE